MRFFLCSFFCVAFSHELHAILDHFVFKDASPKCCKSNEVLLFHDHAFRAFYECVPDKNKLFQIHTKSVLPNFVWNSTAESPPCIDIVENKKSGERSTQKIDSISGVTYTIDLNAFPKCCPVHYSYEPVQHKCVPIFDETHQPDPTEEIIKRHLEDGLIYIKIGLTDYDSGVIVDYKLPSFDASIFNEDKGIRVENLNETADYGGYCIDKLYNSEEFVVRVRHDDFSVCKRRKTDVGKLRCFRKCCPDGQFYRNGPKCVADFEVGLALKDDPNIRNADEPFGIIPVNSCRKYKNDIDNYFIDDRGMVHTEADDYPPLVFSPFKGTYCLEHLDMDGVKSLGLFYCLVQ